SGPTAPPRPWCPCAARTRAAAPPRPCGARAGPPRTTAPSSPSTSGPARTRARRWCEDAARGARPHRGPAKAVPGFFQSRGAMSSASFEFGPFRLDTGKHVLWREGELVPLTPKALAVLQVLVEARGDVVPKPDLMARVWPDTVVEEANLSVTV